MVDLESIVVVTAFLALFRRFLRGQSERLDGILLIGYAILNIVKSVASGWLGAAVLLVLEIGVCYFDVRRRIPKLALAGLIVIVLFLQPGKGDSAGDIGMALALPRAQPASERCSGSTHRCVLGPMPLNDRSCEVSCSVNRSFAYPCSSPQPWLCR